MTETAKECINMESLLSNVNLDSITLPKEQRKASAAMLIKLAYEEADDKVEELNKNRSVTSEQKHVFLSAIWEYIEEGMEILNKRSDRINISAIRNGISITFTFSKKEEGKESKDN